MGRGGLGELEHQVMLALLHLGEDAYTAPIVAELEERTDRTTTLSSVYIVLRRLEEKGWAASRMQPVESGRDRRIFEVTEEGLERLREERRAFERLWEGLDSLLEARG